MTALSAASSGGIVQSNKENGRWGYVREDDNDVRLHKLFFMHAKGCNVVRVLASQRRCLRVYRRNLLRPIFPMSMLS